MEVERDQVSRMSYEILPVVLALVLEWVWHFEGAKFDRSWMTECSGGAFGFGFHRG